jgi:flagellar protein FliL
MVVQLGVLGVLTAVAIGSGWFAGSMMTAPTGADAAHGETAHATETTTSEIGDIAIVHLEPITTQLAAPSTMWPPTARWPKPSTRISSPSCVR